MILKLKMARILFTGLMLALALGLISLPASAQQFITISYPGATGTYSEGINNRGEIVGNYADSGGVFHVFTPLNGQFTAFNVPGALGTFPAGTNDLGEIVGSYVEKTTS